MALNIFEPAPPSKVGFGLAQFNRLTYDKNYLELSVGDTLELSDPIITPGSLLDQAIEHLLGNWPEGRPMVILAKTGLKAREIVIPEVYQAFAEAPEPGWMPFAWTLDRLRAPYEALGWSLMSRGLICEVRDTNPELTQFFVWPATETQKNCILAFERLQLAKFKTLAYRAFLALASYMQWESMNPSADNSTKQLVRKQLFLPPLEEQTP